MFRNDAIFGYTKELEMNRFITKLILNLNKASRFKRYSKAFIQGNYVRNFNINNIQRESVYFKELQKYHILRNAGIFQIVYYKYYKWYYENWKWFNKKFKKSWLVPGSMSFILALCYGQMDVDGKIN